MKQTILAKLKLKFPGLPVDMLGMFADKLAVTVTAEDQIDQAITDLENGPVKPSDFADFTQREGDRRVRAAENTLKGKYDFVAKKTPAAESEVDDTDTDTDNPKGSGKLYKMIEGLTAQVQTLVKEKSAQTYNDKLATFLKENKMPPYIGTGVQFTNDEEFEAYKATILESHTVHLQGQNDTNLKESGSPADAVSGSSAEKAAEANIDNFVAVKQKQAGVANSNAATTT